MPEGQISGGGKFSKSSMPCEGLSLSLGPRWSGCKCVGRISLLSSTCPDSCNGASRWTLLGGSDNGSNVCSDWGFNKLQSLMQALFHSLLGENAHTSDSKVFCQLAMYTHPPFVLEFTAMLPSSSSKARPLPLVFLASPLFVSVLLPPRVGFMRM